MDNFPLPAYVDREAWDGFRDMRKAIKKPMTVRAAKLILYELQRIKDAGHCPNAALDQSTNHCWADVYQPKDKPIEPARRQQADETAKYLEQQREHAQRAQQERIRRVS